MSLEVTPRPVQLVSPRTGEVLDLDSPTEDLGRLLADVREHEGYLRELKRAVSGEVLRRMDTGATWTLRAGDVTLKGSSPAPAEEWDELALRTDLWELVDEGVITEDAAGAAVETVVTYRVRKAGVNALRKLGGRVAEVVDRHCRSVEKDRYVTVSRA